MSAALDIAGTVVAAGALALSWFAWGPRAFIVATALMAAWIMFHVLEVLTRYRLRRARRQLETGTGTQLESVAVTS